MKVKKEVVGIEVKTFLICSCKMLTRSVKYIKNKHKCIGKE